MALRAIIDPCVISTVVLLRGEKEAPKAEAIVMTIQQPFEAY
jgi:hypothetical protein